MRSTWKVIGTLVLGSLVLAGCRPTNDFKVVDALRVGMSAEEAKGVIRSYGFELEESLQRPVQGWPAERTGFAATAWRAGREEVRSGQPVAVVEHYPVRHGMLGAGQLFLFYGADGRLMHFYRHQIN